MRQVHAGWEKGQVEKNVRDARHRLWQVAPDFPDLEALNNWLEDRCTVLWAETAHGTKTHILNLLHRLVDGTPINQPDVTPPSVLALNKEPEANVSRYDGLRQGGKRHAS